MWPKGQRTNLIHMLAKQDTPMNASRTAFGSEPARLRTLVMSIRSMLVLLKAEDMVKPPMRSMMVGENMTENIHLESMSRHGVHAWREAYLVAFGGDMAVPS